MARLKNDELNYNEYPKERSMPIDDYFDEMELEEDEKEERKQLAFLFFDLLLMAFTMIKADKKLDKDIDIDYYSEMLTRRFRNAIESKRIDLEEKYPYLWTYSQSTIKDVLETTTRHLNDTYYTSRDRARLIAEEESNTVYNYVGFEDAVEEGNKYKTWITMRDNRVRDTHEEVDGQTIGIYEKFIVGGSEMDYPRDIQAPLKEICGCRCSIKYSKEKE